MPSQDRPKSPGRTAQPLPSSLSSRSLSKDGTLSGQLQNAHKGSSTKLHKAHGVGVNRHPHTRVPSHGKGLNKLAKLSSTAQNDDTGHSRHHRRSASHTPSTSPGTLQSKRNSSTLALTKAGAKISVKRNMSHPNLSRNTSTAKLGNQPKSEKAQVKTNLSKKGTDDQPVFGGAQFEVGDELQEDEWTEESGSLSPVTTRSNSRPKTPVTPGRKDLSSRDQPAESPSDTGAIRGSKLRNRNDHEDHPRDYSHPPDAQAVTKRLLSRTSNHNLVPQTSNISASVTPHHVGSPRTTHSQGSTIGNDSSMPEEGISRFLSRPSTGSGDGTPGSVSHLQQNLANWDRHQHDQTRPSKPSGTRRTKSAANLTSHILGQNENELPPQGDDEAHDDTKLEHDGHDRKKFQPSPFESARGANPTAGKSYTQLKLNLDREAVSRDPPLTSHPLMINQGSMLNMAGSISSNIDDLRHRIKRQYAQAHKDTVSCRKYYPRILVDRIPERAVRRYQTERGPQGKEKRGREKKRGSSQAASSPAETLKGGAQDNKMPPQSSRAKVRFEIGGRSFGDGDESRRESFEAEREYDEEDGLEALLRRMWTASEPREEDVD